MRRLHSHKINRFNRDHVVVAAIDTVGAAEQNAEYEIAVRSEAQTDDEPDRQHEVVRLKFQQGDPKEQGFTGITDEALLTVLIDRLQGRQRSRPTRAIACAITKAEECLHWMADLDRAEETRGQIS